MTGRWWRASRRRRCSSWPANPAHGCSVEVVPQCSRPPNHGSTLLPALRPLKPGPRTTRGVGVISTSARARSEASRQRARRGRSPRQSRSPPAGQSRRLEHRNEHHRSASSQRLAPADPAGHPRSTSIEMDHPRERGQSCQKARRGRQLPVRAPMFENHLGTSNTSSGLHRPPLIAICRPPLRAYP